MVSLDYYRNDYQPKETQMAYQLSIGSISSGTLLAEDLLSDIAGEMESLARAGNTDVAMLLDAILSWLGDDEENRPEERGDELVNEAIDLLNEYVPPFCYFGFHPGDGACLGVWPDIDAMEDELVKVSDPSELDELDDDIHEAMFVSDHGNVTYYAKENGVWIAQWDVV